MRSPRFNAPRMRSLASRISILNRPQSSKLSLTPNFSWVTRALIFANRFNGFSLCVEGGLIFDSRLRDLFYPAGRVPQSASV
jgi:hypothetical protein